ncbi:MAG: diguanylate cyclase [Candidatus Ancillula sp.]|jgi:dihydroorotate dehydrogenase|nr:diguanylate cyclase [Candidatus Ancillula sp.]
MSSLLYNPNLTYLENFAQGPFDMHGIADTTGVSLPFGIPAGPLLHSRHCIEAFKAGFDICVYKTVRNQQHPCNDFPNVMFVHPDAEDISFAQADAGILTDFDMPHIIKNVNISNSFGVPSMSPDFWQEDMRKANDAAGENQLLIGSFQGSGTVQSFVDAAKMVTETGVKVLEMNTSCPNEGKDNLLCFDPQKVGEIAEAVKNAIGDLELHIKIAYMRKCGTEEIDEALLDELLRTTVERGTVQGIAAINTIPSRLVNASGGDALTGGRSTSGVCGGGIKWAGLKMVEALDSRRDRLRERGVDFSITGVGGVADFADYTEYRGAGADSVLAATVPMFNPRMAIEVKKQALLATL